VKIAAVAASAHRVPVQVPLVASPRTATVLVVRVESDDGLVGHGVAGPQSPAAVAELVNRELGPFVVGHDPLMAEQLAHILEQRFNSRAMSGIVSSALSGVDIALWDLRGKLLGQPVWRLLGGFSPTVRAYITFGLPEYDTDQLVEAARLAVSRGYTQLKMVVGRSTDDTERVRRVRDAIGAGTRLMIDANEGLDLLQATQLARQVEAFDIAWFEEPVLGNEVRLLAELRLKTTIPVAAGQFEGHRFRLRDLAIGSAVDILQTNVLYVGGYTAGLKVAHLADVFRLPVANGGGWPDHNAHLMAAVANNHGVEMHAWQWMLAETLYGEAPHVRNGWYHLREAPGLGLEPLAEVLRETRV
jgi:L-alanine-DL-glutamate epimerase-like enolase superfamily enzyme